MVPAHAGPILPTPDTGSLIQEGGDPADTISWSLRRGNMGRGPLRLRGRLKKTEWGDECLMRGQRTGCVVFFEGELLCGSDAPVSHF